MPTKPQHTPTPKHKKCCTYEWHLGSETCPCQKAIMTLPLHADRVGNAKNWWVIKDSSGIAISQLNEYDFAEKRAAFIVRAVNSYEELLHLVKEMQKELARGGLHAFNTSLIIQAEKAIAKAEGRYE